MIVVCMGRPTPASYLPTAVRILTTRNDAGEGGGPQARREDRGLRNADSRGGPWGRPQHIHGIDPAPGSGKRSSAASGSEGVWWPQRDSNPCFSLERATS